MKIYLALLFLISVPVYADDCDSVAPETVAPGDSKKIYPYKPIPTATIDCRLRKLLEGDFKSDLREITRLGLQRGKTKVQPWNGYFWPITQGIIANPYQERNYEILHGALSGLEMLSWKKNYNNFKKRKTEIHSKVLELKESDLAKLAPSEKYDLLLGDKTFDLTNRVWSYAATWGEKNKWGFLSSIDVPAGYEIPSSSGQVALWEGICHGWAVAAGNYPRPEKTVWVTLPNQKKMPFYPHDLKALTAYMWANSTIQDSVIVEGLRCNQKSPKKDENGRFIDTEYDKGDTTLLPRCADVHPAIYHASIVNLVGLEGRSFVVDKSAKNAISNQPVSGYAYQYFHPESGKDGALEASAVSVERYAKDPFKASRNQDTKFIVGVAMVLSYLKGEEPIHKDTNEVADDKLNEMKFNYDLELDANFKIIGGQWRVDRDGSGKLFGNTTHQPDFFWVVPRDFKKFFKPRTDVPAWDFQKSTLPPKEYTQAALGAHSFIYEISKKFGYSEKCQVFPMKKGTGPMREVDCEFKYNRPQPLINVVNTLMEESSR